MDADTVGQMRSSRWHLLGAALVVLAIVGAGFATASGHFVQLAPGPAIPVATALKVTHPLPGNPGSGSSSSPLLTTVAARPLSNGAAIACWLRPGCHVTVYDLPATSGTATPDTQMEAALQHADQAADRYLHGAGTWPEAPGRGLRVPGIEGPSAGLAFTLYFLQQRTAGSLFAGHTVAATGEISPAGAVGDVAGVQFKAAGAVKAGADVFFVPVGEVADADGQPRLRVVGVRSVADAVTWLCRHGATSTVCRL